jgi:hypothetical protein
VYIAKSRDLGRGDHFLDEVSFAILSATFGGLAASLLTLIAMRWSTLKTIKSAEESLRVQLLYEEKRRALKELRHLVDQKYKTYPDFKQSVLSFLQTFESDFVPIELKNEIRSQIGELDKFLEDTGLAPGEPTEKEIDLWAEQYQEEIASLPVELQAEHEFEERLGSIKSSVRNLITKYVKL